MTRVERDRLKQLLHSFSAGASSSEKRARKLLESTGIFTKSGKVTAHYGGETVAVNPDADATVPRPTSAKLSRTSKLGNKKAA